MPAKTKTVKSPPEGALTAMLDAIKETNGAEIQIDDWPVAEALAQRGLITLGPARGPFRAWRRAELVNQEAEAHYVASMGAFAASVEAATKKPKTKRATVTKQWIATFKVTYTTHVTVEAATEEEAREKFKGFDWADERVDGVTDHDFDDRTKIEDVS